MESARESTPIERRLQQGTEAEHSQAPWRALRARACSGKERYPEAGKTRKTAAQQAKGSAQGGGSRTEGLLRRHDWSAHGQEPPQAALGGRRARHIRGSDTKC